MLLIHQLVTLLVALFVSFAAVTGALPADLTIGVKPAKTLLGGQADGLVSDTIDGLSDSFIKSPGSSGVSIGVGFALSVSPKNKLVKRSAENPTSIDLTSRDASKLDTHAIVDGSTFTVSNRLCGTGELTTDLTDRLEKELFPIKLGLDMASTACTPLTSDMLSGSIQFHPALGTKGTFTVAIASDPQCTNTVSTTSGTFDATEKSSPICINLARLALKSKRVTIAASEGNFVLGAFIFEDFGVATYRRAVPLLDTGTDEFPSLELTGQGTSTLDTRAASPGGNAIISSDSATFLPVSLNFLNAGVISLGFETITTPCTALPKGMVPTSAQVTPPPNKSGTYTITMFADSQCSAPLFSANGTFSNNASFTIAISLNIPALLRKLKRAPLELTIIDISVLVQVDLFIDL